MIEREINMRPPDNTHDLVWEWIRFDPRKQIQIAKDAGIDKDKLSRWILCKREMTSAEFVRLLETLGAAITPPDSHAARKAAATRKANESKAKLRKGRKVPIRQRRRG